MKTAIFLFLITLLFSSVFPLYNSTKADFALPDFLSFTNLNNLVSYNNRLAWVELYQGIVNIYVAEGPQFSRRKLTQFKGDDGLVIDGINFIQNGNFLLYNVYPSDGSNPLGLDLPYVPEIHYIAWDGSKSGKLFGNTIAAVSDFGDILFVTSDGGWNTVSSQTISAGPKTLFRERSYLGTLESFQFLPGTRDFVFVSNRFDHAFVGLYRNSSQAIEWIDPSFDTDYGPVVCQNSKMIAFYRFYSKQAANGQVLIQEWEVRVSDLTKPGNPTHLVYKDDQVGWPLDYPGAYGVRPLVFTENCEQLIFHNEVTQWQNINIINVDGSNRRAVTSKQCEFQSYIYSNRTLFTSDNCGSSLNTRSIHAINIDTLEMTPLTPDLLTELSGMASGGSGLAVLQNNLLAYVHTSWNSSTAVRVLDVSNPTNIIQVTSGNFPAASTFVQPEWISFESTDKQFTIYCQLFLPRNFDKSKKHPAVVFTHGGPMRQMYTSMHFGIDYSQLYVQNQYLAYQGYPVLSINYRRGVGYGRKFRLCDKCGQWGGAEYIDVLGGNTWLASQPWVDADHIGIYGLSYGGLNCLQAVTRNSDKFSVGVANAPVFNWLSQGRFDGATLFDYMPQVPTAIHVGPEANLATPAWPSHVDSNMKIAFESSPAAYTQKVTIPVLLIQGDMDRNVDIQESIGFIRALRNRGYTNVFGRMFPGERHALALFRNEVLADPSIL